MMHALLLAMSVLVPTQDPMPIQKVLVIDSLSERSRSAVFTDALEHLRALGTLEKPVVGGEILDPGGTARTWKALEADKEGLFKDSSLRGQWAYARVIAPETGAYILDARGHSYALIDGEPRSGDVYGLGTSRLPMHLDKGAHELYFRIGRPPFAATLRPAPVPAFFEEVDRTVPDFLQGQGGRLLIGQLISNASDRKLEGWSVMATAVLPASVPSPDPIVNSLPQLLPSSQVKQALWIPVPLALDGDTFEVQLSLRDDRDNTVHECTLSLDVREEFEKHKRTFLSDVDGSVQYFAVTPPPTPLDSGEMPALILSLHGASVEATNQARVYSQKTWAYVVAPTNRRPFGFDWEDWGRDDAREVLKLAETTFGTDPNRTYLTGHSMGGHGTWQIGAHLSSRFAAIAPSAGWKDFWSYGGGATFPENDNVGLLLSRSVNASRTALLKANYDHVGVYVLHGDDDRTVSVNEARGMRALLGTQHTNFAYYERAGGGHWWGDECVDWPPLIDFLKQNVRPNWDSALELEFVTINPSIRSSHGWLTIERAAKILQPARLKARLDPETRVLELEGENLGRFVLDLRKFVLPAGDSTEAVLPAGSPLIVKWLDSEMPVEWQALSSPLTLVPQGQGSLKQQDLPLAPWFKGPHRMGPLKAGFNNRMVFVYGTSGSDKEDRWAYAKARYDHETWRYRGNGSVTILQDIDFDPKLYPDRNVVLYGNQDTNSAWFSVLQAKDIELTRNHVKVGSHSIESDDLALLCVYPRKGSDIASVVIVGGTGLPGCRLTEQLPYFVSGVGYPDWTLLKVSFLQKGLEGIVGTGFFRDDWSTEIGAETVWR